MKVLALNAGSSSLKVALFEVGADGAASLRARGEVERIGRAGARVTYRAGGDAIDERREVADHAAAAGIAFSLLRTLGASPPLAGGAAPDAIGHRIVHGGDEFPDAVRVDRANRARIEACAGLAPLHAGPNLAVLGAALETFPDVPSVAVFDTAFFHGLPPRAARYAVPEAWFAEHGVRRFGFHGTSHRFVAERAAALLGRPAPDLVTLHLGNGCSAACIRGGVAVDTSMGFTPLEGLVMGTRSGDVDPAVVFHLVGRGLPFDEIRRGLEEGGGLLGLSGLSSDVRDLSEAAGEGHAGAALALDVFVHRVRRYLGAYLVELPQCDGVVFTGGIGEHAAALRARVLEGLETFGLALDPQRNAAAGGGERSIHRADGRVPVLVVPTDEERAIARETADLVRRSG